MVGPAHSAARAGEKATLSTRAHSPRHACRSAATPPGVDTLTPTWLRRRSSGEGRQGGSRWAPTVVGRHRPPRLDRIPDRGRREWVAVADESGRPWPTEWAGRGRPKCGRGWCEWRPGRREWRPWSSGVAAWRAGVRPWFGGSGGRSGRSSVCGRRKRDRGRSGTTGAGRECRTRPRRNGAAADHHRPPRPGGIADRGRPGGATPGSARRPGDRPAPHGPGRVPRDVAVVRTGKGVKAAATAEGPRSRRPGAPRSRTRRSCGSAGASSRPGACAGPAPRP